MKVALFLSYKSGYVVSRASNVCRLALSSILTASKSSVVLMLLTFLAAGSIPAVAQGEQTEETHAHSSSFHWKGIDVNTVIGQSEYDPLPGSFNPPINKYPFSKGKVIFLYNVGTGKFIIEGGNYGMEGRLFHETFGRPLYLFSDGYILSGIMENNNQKFIFGCNASGPFNSNPWTKWNEFSFTMMMDADKSKRDGWHFERVEDPSNTETYTYYMYEKSTTNGYKDNMYFFGAAYGECKAAAWKGDGKLVFMDDDRAAWTTYDPRGKTDKYEVNGDQVTLDELYQWRLVDEVEFRSMLDNEEIGLNPSVSIFITDRDFTRNSQVFNDSWLVEDKEGHSYTEKHRLGFTYASSDNSNGKSKQKEYNDNQAWDKPIRLKHVFDDNSANYGWENAKYGFLTFEGVGRTYTEVEVPRPGWYLVQCYGFVQSDNDHDAYIFARVKGSTETSSTGGYSESALQKVAAGTYTGKNVKDSCLNVGKELTRNGEKYINTVWICVTQEQFNAGVDTLQIGVGKDEATKSAAKRNNNKDYYYDTDWVCVDDFRMSYLGLRPAFFYEDEESLDYITPNETNSKQYLGASPTGQYGGAICLERTMKKGQWNSFSFPMPLTGEQIRNAFGEDAKLAKIHSVGKMSQNPEILDFQLVSLRTTDDVVKPGNFYLLKPTKEPTEGYDPKGQLTTYYELGRKYFSVNDEPDSYTHDRLSVDTKMMDTLKIASLDGMHDGKAGVNYVQTPGSADFRVSDGIYTGTVAEGIYAPKGSYVVSNNTIVHLNKDTPLKGFRGWIDLSSALDSGSKEYTMDVYGMFEEEPGGGSVTGVPRIVLFGKDEAVYDISGRKVGTLGDQLTKGLYIVKGKKYLVK